MSTLKFQVAIDKLMLWYICFHCICYVKKTRGDYRSSSQVRIYKHPTHLLFGNLKPTAFFLNFIVRIEVGICVRISRRNLSARIIDGFSSMKSFPPYSKNDCLITSSHSPRRFQQSSASTKEDHCILKSIYTAVSVYRRKNWIGRYYLQNGIWIKKNN